MSYQFIINIICIEIFCILFFPPKQIWHISVKNSHIWRVNTYKLLMVTTTESLFHFTCCWQVLSHVQLFATPWAVAHQAPLSMGFFKVRILERVAISFFRGRGGGSSWPRDQSHVSCHSCLGRPILYHLVTYTFLIKSQNIIYLFLTNSRALSKYKLIIANLNLFGLLKSNHH